MSQQINLFNPIFLKQKKVFTVVPMAEALAIIVVGAAALVGYGKYRVDAADRHAAHIKEELATKLARQSSVTVEFAPRQKSAQVEAELAQVEARLKALREVDGLLRGGQLGVNQGYAEYFRALARQHVSGLWLTGVSITGAGSDIEVQGKAMQAPLIPAYIARLTGENIMRGKTFSSLMIDRPAPPAVAAGAAPVAPAAAAASTAAPNELLNLLLSKGALATARAMSAPPSAAQSAPAPATPIVAAPAAPAVSPFVEFTLQSAAVSANRTEAK